MKHAATVNGIAGTVELMSFENPELYADGEARLPVTRRNRKKLAHGVVGLECVENRAADEDWTADEQALVELADVNPRLTFGGVEVYENGARNLYLRNPNDPRLACGFLRFRPTGTPEELTPMEQGLANAIAEARQEIDTATGVIRQGGSDHRINDAAKTITGALMRERMLKRHLEIVRTVTAQRESAMRAMGCECVLG